MNADQFDLVARLTSSAPRRHALRILFGLALAGPVLGHHRALARRPASQATPEQRLAPTSCAEVETLRRLSDTTTSVTNSATDHTLRYAVIGDGARGDDVILFFNGTGGILPDWPVQMLTNQSASPKIASTPVFNAAEDGQTSLCHDFRLVLFDYPGVGASGNAPSSVTFDQIAADVGVMLDDVSNWYGIATSRVHLVGWSLGTLAALKFALLSPTARPDRTIGEVVLIATKPGGGAAGHQAACVTSLFDRTLEAGVEGIRKLRIETELFKLTFPYEGQQPYDGAESGCEIDPTLLDQIRLNVTPARCGIGSTCGAMLANYLANRTTAPWADTHGVPADVYSQQRELVSDWDSCFCAAAGADYASAECSCDGAAIISELNGGVCQCQADETTPQAPTCNRCAPLTVAGGLTVLNGREDLFIQWTHGRELVRAYQESLGDRAKLVTYDGEDGAGHGILLQHPRWVQEQIAAALSGS